MSTYQTVQKGQEWRASQAPTVRAELPVRRLVRLGADVDRLAAWKAVWRRLEGGDEGRDAFLDELGTMTDSELEDLIAGQPVMGEARPVAALDGWARKAPHREIAAALAIVVEEARGDDARDGLLRRLAGIR